MKNLIMCQNGESVVSARLVPEGNLVDTFAQDRPAHPGRAKREEGGREGESGREGGERGEERRGRERRGRDREGAAESTCTTTQKQPANIYIGRQLIGRAI
jgi:hypothetical protein